MTYPGNKPDSLGAAVAYAIPVLAGASLDDYLVTTASELNVYAKLLDRGETLGRDARGWVLDQVDFIVETIGDDSLNLADEMRSSLLQLLLAIANLNEQNRRQASSGI